MHNIYIQNLSILLAILQISYRSNARIVRAVVDTLLNDRNVQTHANKTSLNVILGRKRKKD